jgi:hypothetical protein
MTRFSRLSAALPANVFQAPEVAVERAAVGAARFDEATDLVCSVADCTVPHERNQERRALPGVVAVSFGHSCAEAPTHLFLDRFQVLSLALEVTGLAEVKPGLDQADEGQDPWSALWRLRPESLVEEPPDSFGIGAKLLAAIGHLGALLDDLFPQGSHRNGPILGDQGVTTKKFVHKRPQFCVLAERAVALFPPTLKTLVDAI